MPRIPLHITKTSSGEELKSLHKHFNTTSASKDSVRGENISSSKMSATASKVAVPVATDANADGIVPLSTWMEFVNPPQGDNKNNLERSTRESIIRKTTVAYGIVELLKRSKKLEDEEILIDNFVITISKKPSPSWDDINGVGMISSGLSLTIEEPSYLSALLEGEDRDGRIVGRCLEVELIAAGPKEKLEMPPEAEMALNNVWNNYLAGMNALAAAAEESNRCRLFARLLYELFTHEPFPDDAIAAGAASITEPPKKRAKPSVSSRKNLMLTRAKGDFDRADKPFQISCIVRMQKLGIPASICLMTQNLLEYALRGDGRQSDDAYESLGVVGEDLHLLLLDPDRFLFDNDNQNTDNMKLLYRKDKLYGRDKEETVITDAFCRVSRGKSEAFFIGGFSGSGKSMLVNSLRNTVNAVGGYTIKHKFDAISQENPLSGVISAFNQICLMIKGSTRPVIAKKLSDEFGVDFSLLIRLLPSISVLFPELVSPAIHLEDAVTMNARSVYFTLLRFVRVVSSPRHPVMLFLDDIQWADSTALDVIHTILSDTMGSCMFFVGTYRNNEVQVDHDLFDLIEKLEISNVPTTKVSLAGLDQEDLNTMISDALCLYPRICKSLSCIVYQKTKGNPFFVLEFMQSLQSRGLLQYNSHQKRWVWNEDITRGEEITNNVLHLLSSKMNGLSDNVQMLLKAMACFGTSTNESVIGYLSESEVYAGVRNGLEGALHDGYIEKDGEGYLKFVHDKVREAAYNLIPDSDKKQFHYDLGKALYSITDGKDVGDTIFLPIASQINHGKEWILKDKDFSICIAELNMKAGKKAIDGCDHKTAYFYLGAAVSLLPEDHWESHYDLSLRVYFLMASAANSTCQYDEAELILQKIFEKARCLDDQLPSYLLMSQILQAQSKVKAVYDTCAAILKQLGESIPETYTPSLASQKIKGTLSAYEKVGDKWFQGEETVDKTLHTTLQFYRAITFASFFCKSHSMVVYFSCNAVQLSLQKGICKHTPMSLLQFTAVVTNGDNAVLCYRIAKNAMSMLKRFDVGAQISELYVHYNARVAWRFEPLQVGIDNFRRGFEAGLSYGDNDMGLHCTFHAVKNSIFSGASLRSILKEIAYYLHLLKSYKSEITRNYLLIFRETVSLLIDNGKATSIEAKASVGDLDDPKNKLREAFFRHSAIRCFWLGHTERCRYYSEKCISCTNSFGQGAPTAYIAKFYHGLNAVDLVRKGKNARKSREVIRAAVASIREVAITSDWNFTNKLRLLEAEQQSLTKCHCQSIALYDASIASAKKSGFIHEQGLACEKAGFYFMRVKNKEKTLEYFQQARECYKEWGSSIKVDFIQKELDGLNE